jgi:hypothetical protein
MRGQETALRVGVWFAYTNMVKADGRYGACSKHERDQKSVEVFSGKPEVRRRIV